MGGGGHVGVADSAEAARKIAGGSSPRGRKTFRWLFARHGAEPRIAALYPPTFDELTAIDNGVAGSPRTVRDFVAAEIEATGGNYFVSWLAFCDMNLAETFRSPATLLCEVILSFS